MGFGVLNKLLSQFSLEKFPEYWEKYTYPNPNLKETLDTFIRYRNGVAHGGDISSEEKITQSVYLKCRTLVGDLMYAMHDRFMTPFSELCTQWEMTYKYIWYMTDKDFTIKYINRGL